MQTLALNPSVQLVNGKPTTTSHQVADFFGKRHDTVLRSIKNLECSPEFRLRNFAEASADISQPNGGTTSYLAYTMTKDGFVFLAMGFTGKEAARWKESYLEAFNSMEETLRTQSVPVPPALPKFITTAQAGELATLIAERFPDGRNRPYAWSRFNKHFRLSGYKTLPADRFADACDYIRTMQGDKVGFDPALAAFMPPDGRYIIEVVNGRPVRQPAPVAADCYSMSLQQFINAIDGDIGAEMTTEQLEKMIQSGVRRLSARSAHHAKLVNNARKEQGALPDRPF